MKRRVLFIVTSDPRVSPKPAEAVRIAAGLAVWQEAVVAVYFCGEAARVMSEEAGLLVEGQSLERHLEILREAGSALLTDGGAEPDYRAMAERIFQAESVAVW